MKHKLVLFALACMLISFIVVLFGCDTSIFSIRTPQLKEFIKNSGFKGDCTSADDGRIFTRLRGTFNLPEPKDSLTLQSNTDKIANALMSVYKEQGANYILKRVNYNDTTHASQYIQYWKSFYLVHQPYYLLITWHPKSKTYTIHNTLYQGKINIPDKVVNISYLKSAYDLMEGENNSNTNYTDLAGLSKEYVDTDTLKTMYVILSPHSLPIPKFYRYEKVFLNLYPTGEKGSSKEFSLQWIYPRSLSDYSDFIIDAQTGNFMGSALRSLQIEKRYTDACKNFLKDSGLSGNSAVKAQYSDDALTISGIKIPFEINDTLSFHKLTDKYMPSIRRMCRQLDSNIKVDYQGIQTVGNKDEMYYYATYRQQFRYPMGGDNADQIYGITFTLDKKAGSINIFARLISPPRENPRSVLSPQAIFDLHKAMYNYAGDTHKFNRAHKRIIRKKVDINTIPYTNSYTDVKTNRTARLQIMPICDGESGSSKELKLVWSVSAYSNWMYNNAIYDPVSGIPISSDYPFAFKEYDYKTSFDPHHHGFYVNIPFLGTPLRDVGSDATKYYVSYYRKLLTYPFIYHVPFYLKSLKCHLPECVISPQTAIAIHNQDGKQQFVWTQLSNISGARNYAPDNPSPGEYENLRLELFPSKVRNTANKYEYKLIWTFNYAQGEPEKIDAVTGEILNENASTGIIY